MPTWNEVNDEVNNFLKEGNPSGFDIVRRKYLHYLYKHTGRPVILYASSFLQKGVGEAAESITDEDLQGIMQVIHGINDDKLDLIIHSPGGSAEAAEAIVKYLRTKFNNIRVIVPHLAMSAAAMIACSADALLMGKHSFIGPIDPQLIMHTPQFGMRMIPAFDILEQFELAKEECKDPGMIGSWLPLLNQYSPGLIVQCKNAITLSKEIVERWLITYMLKNDVDKDNKAHCISQWLSNHGSFKSHSRHISRDELLNMGFIIEQLEADQTAQDLFLSVYHAATITFGGTHCTKVIENHMGKAFVKMSIPLGFMPQQTPQTEKTLIPQLPIPLMIPPLKGD